MTPERLPQGYYRKTGTVLLRRDASREGQSLLLFMRDFGPRWAGAPAASSRNRFGGGTEPLVWGEFSLYQSPTKLYLQGVEVKEDFLSLRSDPKALLCAMRLYRLTARETPADCENDALLRMLWSAMIQLKEKAAPYIAEFRYMWKLMDLFGIAPSLELCSSCGELFKNGAVFTQDGLLCPRCAGTSAVIGMEALAEMRAAAALPHDNFIVWSRLPHKKETFTLNLKKLSPFFRNMR